ncbi:MAG: phosphoribosylanthranilate isomerase [Leucobacter sp.]
MNTMYVKICGLRDAGTATHAIQEGADAVGVVMSDGSPRNASLEEARAVVSAARQTSPGVDVVLVVRHMPAASAAGIAQELGFDVLQLHGNYSREDFAAATAILPRVWRAASLAHHPGLHAGEYGEERLLVDSPIPGSGQQWDLSALETVKLGETWLLAGGLSAEIVARAVRMAQPGGVDVSSGVESAPGVKSLELISQFIHAARASASQA